MENSTFYFAMLSVSHLSAVCCDSAKSSSTFSKLKNFEDSPLTKNSYELTHYFKKEINNTFYHIQRYEYIYFGRTCQIQNFDMNMEQWISSELRLRWISRKYLFPLLYSLGACWPLLNILLRILRIKVGIGKSFYVERSNTTLTGIIWYSSHHLKSSHHTNRILPEE